MVLSLHMFWGKKLAIEYSVTNWRSEYFKMGDLDLFVSDGKRLRSYRLYSSYLALLMCRPIANGGPSYCIMEGACATACLGPARMPSSMYHLRNKREEQVAMAETIFCRTKQNSKDPHRISLYPRFGADRECTGSV